MVNFFGSRLSHFGRRLSFFEGSMVPSDGVICGAEDISFILLLLTHRNGCYLAAGMHQSPAAFLKIL